MAIASKNLPNAPTAVSTNSRRCYGITFNGKGRKKRRNQPRWSLRRMMSKQPRRVVKSGLKGYY
ncbi:hypothetical protein R6Q59_000249 [Mikania micrantha]